MHATIRKMSKQVDKLQQDVEDAKDKLDAAKRKVKKRLFWFKPQCSGKKGMLKKCHFKDHNIIRGEEMEALILCLTSPKYTALYILL